MRWRGDCQGIPVGEGQVRFLRRLAVSSLHFRSHPVPNYSQRVAITLLLSGLTMATSLSAQYAPPPVANNAFITYLGLDWAWASPCRMSGETCDPTYIFVDNFRFATAVEWANRPAISAFLDPAGNWVGDGNGQMRCASAYFTLTFTQNGTFPWCDYGDAVNGLYGSGPDLFVLDHPWRETWLVRGATLPNDVVPEPATMTLLATGLVGIVGAGLRRRRKA
jgi:hypothetical protein